MPGEYLASLAACRALYRVIFKEAVGLLPPPERRHTGALVSHRTVSSLAKEAGVAPSTASADLTRLVGYGWVTSIAAPREIGRYEGQSIYLRADIAAAHMTGQMDVVSKMVVGDLIDAMTPSMDEGQRGVGRVWVDDPNVRVLGRGDA